MKNTKYIKVSVKDRQPEKEGTYICIFSNNIARSIQYYKEYSFADEFTDCSGITHWLQEVPDYEDEMKEMLAKCMLEFGRFKAEFGQGNKLELEIKSLLTKLKTES